MGYYKRAELPFQFALADAFTLCDAYHCSIQAGTNPNRLFLWTGTNDPTGADGGRRRQRVGQPRATHPTDGYTWTTYPERLQEAGVSWKVYQNMADNFGDNPLAGFLQLPRANAATGNGPDGSPYTVYDAAARGRRSADQGHRQHDARRRVPRRVPSTTWSTARLPQVSWIVARRAYSRAPRPVEPGAGRVTTRRRCSTR